MSKGTKVNPRRIPCTMATINKVRDESIHLAMAIFLLTLKDDFGFDNDQITHVWKRVDKLSQEVAEGRVNIWDFVDTLLTEHNIDLR